MTLGPDAVSYFTALARCQQAWLRKYAVPRPLGDPYRRADVEESPEAICKLLDAYIALLPYMLPEEDELLASVLWHPDLSRSNILVAGDANPTSTPPKLAGVIDWQNTCAAPLILQAIFPPAFEYTGSMVVLPKGIALPSKPDNLKTLPPEEQELMLGEWKDAVLHKWLETAMMRNWHFNTAQAHPYKLALDTLAYGTTSTWSHGSVWFAETLRGVELDARAKHPDRELPVVVPEEDLARHQAEFEKQAKHQWHLNVVQERLGIQGDGWVENEDYEWVKEELANLRVTEWSPEKEEELGPWPWQEGVWPADE